MAGAELHITDAADSVEGVGDDGVKVASYSGGMQLKVRGAFLILWLALFRAGAPAQATHPSSGRQIAPVMGMGGADWLVRSERVEEEAPDAALDAIGIKKGDVIADVGAGV